MKITIEEYMPEPIVIDAGPALVIAQGADGRWRFVVNTETGGETLDLVAHILAKFRDSFGAGAVRLAVARSEEINTKSVGDLGGPS